MTFIVQILGSNSAAPAHNRHPSAQLLRIGQDYFLIDCGEGTQMQLAKYNARFNRINHIFISHLHGDHYLGLVGLLSTMHLNKRTDVLHLYAPPGLGEILTTQFKYSDTRLNYQIDLHEIIPVAGVIFENQSVTVETIPLNHRIPCTGFLFREQPKSRRIDKDRLPPDLSIRQLAQLKKGEDVTDRNGEVIFKNAELTLPPKRSRSYAYCSDTQFSECIVPQIRGVDLLYHEATFLQDQAVRAAETYHSTAQQAARIARSAGVQQLMLGHYSSRYKDLEPFLTESKEIFANTILAIEGEEVWIDD